MRITLDIPKEEVPCLLVALQHGATDFAVSARQERDTHRLARKPFSAETKETVEAWDRHFVTLMRLKEEIRRKAGIP